MQTYNNNNNNYYYYSSDSLSSESVEEINTSSCEDVISNLSTTLHMLQKHRFRQVKWPIRPQQVGFEEAIDGENSITAQSGSAVEPKSAPTTDRYYKEALPRGNQEERLLKISGRDAEHSSNLDGCTNGEEKSGRQAEGAISRRSVQVEHRFSTGATTTFERASFESGSFEQRFEHNMKETGKLFDISSSKPLDDPDFINLGRLDDENSIDTEVFNGQHSRSLQQNHAKRPCPARKKCRQVAANTAENDIFNLMLHKKMKVGELDAAEQSGPNTYNLQRSSNRPSKRQALQREEMNSDPSCDSIASIGRGPNRLGKGCLDTLSERVKRKVWSAFCIAPELEGDTTGMQESGRTLEIREKEDVSNTGGWSEKKSDAERCLEMAKFYVEECDDLQQAIDVLQKAIGERNGCDADSSKGFANLLDYYAQLMRRVAVGSLYQK